MKAKIEIKKLQRSPSGITLCIDLGDGYKAQYAVSNPKEAAFICKATKAIAQWHKQRDIQRQKVAA